FRHRTSVRHSLEALAIFSTVLGRTLVLPQTSSLPDLYLWKTCRGACQECGLKSSEHEPRRSKDL
uniref:Uncharacterized protein n=1 Tax=Cucumis melo TaxID=3656 RepID=A0A9I9EL75_CUCME